MDNISHIDLLDVSADQHHLEDHAARHADGGADEVVVEGLPTAETDTTFHLTPDGLGGLQFVAAPSGGSFPLSGTWERTTRSRVRMTLFGLV